MGLFSQLLAGIFTFSLMASPSAALMQTPPTLPARSGSQNMNASVSSPAVLAGGIAGAATIASASQLFLPGSLLTSFGGRIIWAEFCDAGLYVIIQPAGLFPAHYIWTWGTITKLYGAPLHIGQQVLGLADVPWVCWVGSGGLFGDLDPRFGLRMTLVGTSFPGTIQVSAPPAPVSI